jgi:two-component system, OmpR family, KDP operon response regulator KdpE
MKFRHLLVAEDNPALRRALRLNLEAEGYDVRVAENGAQALKLQRERPAEVLITDLFMPDCDGFEAISGFRERFPGTLIVAISGEAKVVKAEMLAAAELVGVDATLRKPFEMAELLGTLAALEARPG